MAYIFVAVLIAILGTLLGLPLLPAIRELRQKRDAEPLNVIQQHAGDIRHFAQSFAVLINELEPVLARSHNCGDVTRGVLPDGSHYVVLSNPDELPVQKQAGLSLCQYVIALSGDVTCPGQISFAKELYVRGNFMGGDGNHYRALLGAHDLRLGSHSTVLRWAHAGGEFTADEGCNLFGRVSAQERIELRRGCRFLRLNAPRIDAGSRGEGNVSAPEIRTRSLFSTTRRVLYDGDAVIDVGEVFYGNIVTRGKLHLRPGAHVVGSIKSNKELIIENEVVVEGSVMGAEQMIIGSRCSLHGPIIAERSMVLYSGTMCGASQKPTTVSSPEIHIQEGVVVFGTLWARESGSVWGRA
jgi:cytoskeletal protein CcmA (bactofilin family)